MKIIAYKYLCAKKKNKKVRIYCTPKLFKPLVLGMGAIFLILVLNLFVNNFFVDIRASVEHFVNSFVNLFL